MSNPSLVKREFLAFLIKFNSAAVIQNLEAIANIFKVIILQIALIIDENKIKTMGIPLLTFLKIPDKSTTSK